jgi:hypothetical protein
VYRNNLHDKHITYTLCNKYYLEVNSQKPGDEEKHRGFNLTPIT